MTEQQPVSPRTWVLLSTPSPSPPVPAGLRAWTSPTANSLSCPQRPTSSAAPKARHKDDSSEILLRNPTSDPDLLSHHFYSDPHAPCYLTPPGLLPLVPPLSLPAPSSFPGQAHRLRGLQDTLTSPPPALSLAFLSSHTLPLSPLPPLHPDLSSQQGPSLLTAGNSRFPSEGSSLSTLAAPMPSFLLENLS